MLLESDHELVDFHFSGSLIKNVAGLGLDVLILFIEGYDLRRWLWLEVVQPVEEFHKRFQGPLLQNLCSLLNVETLVKLKRHCGIVEGEHRRVSERPWDHFLGEIPRRITPKIAAGHEGNVID